LDINSLSPKKKDSFLEITGKVLGERKDRGEKGVRDRKGSSQTCMQRGL
jgi:hypothetical protein